MFESRVLRRIFGPKRDEVTGGWRKLRKNLTWTVVAVTTTQHTLTYI
jgi:hypothetical protein